MKNLMRISLLGLSISLLAFITKEKTTIDPLEAYVGTYKMIDNAYFSVFKITIKEGSLYGEADENGANKLLKQEQADTFKSTSQYGSIIKFKRNTETNKVTGLTLNLQDTEMVGEKQ
ncbi:MAG: DUF3471 domain-containing protein [Spirosomataceae bacterium]